VENVLRGDLRAGKTIQVYYFGFASTIDAGSLLGIWHPPEPAMLRTDRYLFFLERDSGVLRTVCDGTAPCVFAVRTGDHVGYKFAPNEPLTHRIADILLTKGSGVTDEQMARSLAKEPIIPVDYPPRDYAIQKLRALSAEGKWLHKGACWILKARFGSECP
jgi:hypothetical protein